MLHYLNRALDADLGVSQTAQYLAEYSIVRILFALMQELPTL